MILKNIDILNFKNIAAATLQFSPGVNCFLGMNGMGKSNLLDGVSMLCLARTMTFTPDNALIKHDADMMMLKGTFCNDTGGEESIACGITKGKGKTLKRNGKDYKRISEHIGRFPVVAVTPNDSRLITGAAEERRKLMDMVISQVYPDYLSSLIRYNRALESRNKMLRAGVRDAVLYESVEEILAAEANAVATHRRNWVNEIAPETESFHNRLSENKESPQIFYKTQLDGADMKTLLKDRLKKDQVLGFTSAGPHRDDIGVTLDSYNLRGIGSQGQLKTFTIALRMAVFNYLKQKKGFTPLLLLDDIFDKLDAGRVAKIMQEVTRSDIFGQIFITDTNRRHLDDIVGILNAPHTLFNVEEGVFTPVS